MLLGVRTPVILRPKEEHYAFATDAHIRAYMHDKSVESCPRDQLKLENIELV